MPVRIEFTKDGMGVVLYHEDVVTGDELFNTISSVYNDDKYLTLKYWIGDRTGCTEFLPDANYFKKIAELNKKESLRNPEMLLALIAPTDLQFGMSRMFEVFADESLFRTKVFRDRNTAEKWIRQELENA
jgi:hypothetical protein